MLERLRADWRRGRALKQLKLGERQYWEWDSKTDAGTICTNHRFDADEETLVLTIFEFWAKDDRAQGIEGRHGVKRANLSLRGVRAYLELVARWAADAGFARLRVRGVRTRNRRQKPQDFEFDLAHYRRSREPGR